MDLQPVLQCLELVGAAEVAEDLAQLAGAAETAETTVQAVAVAVERRLVSTRGLAAMVHPATSK